MRWLLAKRKRDAVIVSILAGLWMLWYILKLVLN